MKCNNLASRYLFAFMLSCTLVMSGCGKSGGLKLVKNIQLKTYEMNGDAYAEMIATLDTGNIMLPALDLPIQNPKNPGVSIGHVSIKPVLGGGSDLGLAVNITQASKGTAGTGGTLPNGTSLPVGGLGGATVIGLTIGNTGSKVYLALGPQTAVLGVAVVIKEFDSIGKNVGGINIFPSFKVGNNITGVAGIFTSATPSQSGIAVFADASSILPGAAATASVLAVRGGYPAQRAYFVDVMPSKKKEQRVYGDLFKMHQKRTRLNIR